MSASEHGATDRGDSAPRPEELDFAALPPVPEGRAWGAEWWIAIGHLRSKKQEAFVSLVTVLSVLGVVVGVAVLNWVISVMHGFEVDLRDKILGTNAHIVVLRYGGNIVDAERQRERVEEVEGVEAASSFVYTEMLIRSPWASTGIILKGIDPERTGDVTHLREDLELGPNGVLETPAQRAELFAAMASDFAPKIASEEEKPLPGIFIGRELAKELEIRPGDKVQVINPLGGGGGLMGMPVPSVKVFRVAGVFYSGMYEYDTKWTYIENEVAQELLKIGDTVTGIEVKVSDIDGVEKIAADIDQALGYPHYTRHWKNLNQKLFEALRLEKWVMGLILSMIVIVAALLIVTTLIMLVITKGREIAILKAMGASRLTVMRIFVIEGSMIGLVGAVLGSMLGLVGCWVLKEYGYPLDTDVYYLSQLPVVVEFENVVAIAVAAFVTCFLATLYPAYKAGSLDPVEGLRNE